MFNMKLGKSTPETLEPQQAAANSMKEIREEMLAESECHPSTKASEALSNDSSPSDIPDHFDDLISEAEVNLGIQAAPQKTMLDADEFHTVFCGGFNFSHHITGLQSLKVDKGDEAARGASKALYDTIVEVPMLHFILRPGGKWMERGFAILAFAGPMAQSLNAELAAKRVTKSTGTDAATVDPVSSPTFTAPGEPDEAARRAFTGGVQ